MNSTLARMYAYLSLLVLAGCGSGGGGGGGSTSTPAATNTETCGSAMATNSTADNIVPVTVTSCGIVSTANMPYANVTICAPGSTTDCKTIGYVLVDTGSYGLRIFASALGSAPSLPAEIDGSGHALLECESFVAGYMWGNVRLADVKLGGLTASSVPVQIIIGDSSAPSVPAACSGTGSSMNSVSLIGANGVLGIGPYALDGGSYYTCTGSTCSAVSSLPSNKRVTNPVTLLSSDSNGVILDMPAISSSSGDSSVTGSLILGIGTRANNALGAVTVLDIDNYGEVQTTFASNTIRAFIDSGSNGLFFNDTSIGACSLTWYQPTTPKSRSATLLGANNGNLVAESFSINSATTLFASSNTAFNNLGGPWGCSTSEFDWGMPFFYGRRVYYGIYGNTISGNAGPFVAF